MTYSKLLVLFVAAAVAAGSATSAYSAETHPRKASRITSGDSNGGCKSGYDTQTSTNTPPDDSTSDNTPAASVTLAKRCRGAVVGQFTSEVSAPDAADFIHIDIRATCIGTGGFRNPCTIGQEIFGSPGHTFLQNGPSSLGTHSVVEVWTDLLPGEWKFEVLPGGNGSANLQFRTFFVEAYRGG